MAAEVKLISSGMLKLLKSKDVGKDLKQRAERIARAAGPGHRVLTGMGRTRARAAVITMTYDAAEREARDKNLTKALMAARG